MGDKHWTELVEAIIELIVFMGGLAVGILIALKKFI